MTGVNFSTEDIPDLSGRVIMVTGGNTGLGFETLRQLGERSPAHLYLAARSRDKAEAAIEKLKAANAAFPPITFIQLDLSSFASVKAAAETFQKVESRLDMLINNAGIMMTAEGLSKEGYEIQFGTNVMGPALFTHLLLPVLEQTAKVNPQTRVVMLSSASESRAPSDIYQFGELKTTVAHRNTTQRYTTSKIADLHWTKAMAERHKDVKFIPVHPGMVSTDLHQNSTGCFLRPFLFPAVTLFATPVEKGALSQIWAAVSPDAKSGEYYGPIGKTGDGSAASNNRELQEQVYRWIENELKGHY